MFYLFNYLLIPVYYLFISRSKKNSQKYFFVVVAIHAVLFRALANPYVYSDTEGYSLAFSTIADMSFRDAVLSINQYTPWGQGYIAINWIIAQFTRDSTFLFVVLSIMTVGGVMWFYYKSSYKPLVTVMLYLIYPMMYLMGFGVVRQHLSVMFLLLALYFVDKLKISIPLAIMGFLCHTSSLIFLPFFFIRNFSFRKYSSFKLVLLVIGGLLFITYGVSYILNYFERYEAVFEKTGDQNNIVPVVIIGSMILMFYYTRTIYKINNVIDTNIVNYIIYGIIVAIFGMTVPSAGRLSLPFIYVIPVALSLLYKYSSKRTLLSVKVYTFFLFFVSILQIIMSISSKGNFAPYYFLWERVN